MSLADYNLWSYFNNSNYILAGAANPYSNTSEFAPDITGYNETWLLSNATLNVSFTSDEVGYAIYERVSENESITVVKASVVDCSGVVSSEILINFSFMEEENITNITYSDMDATFWVSPLSNTSINTTASFNFTDVGYAEICLYPTWATVVVDSFQTYEGNESGFSAPRAYFLDSAEMDNSTIENITLYNIETSLSKLIVIEVDDDGGQAVDDAYIYFSRYYPDENVYRTVAMVLTDDFGEGNTYLRPNDIWFRITVVQDDVVLSVFSPQTISCDPAASACSLYLNLAPSEYLEFVQYVEDFAYYCSFNISGLNATTCSYTDTSGLMQYARLVVWKNELFSPTNLCDTNLTTASGSISCSLGDVNGTYTYSFSAHFADEIVLETGSIERGGIGALFGAEGLFLAIALFLLCVGVGSFNPGVSVIMGFVGVVVAFTIGVFNIEFSAIVALGVVAIALYLQLR